MAECRIYIVGFFYATLISTACYLLPKDRGIYSIRTRNSSFHDLIDEKKHGVSHVSTEIVEEDIYWSNGLELLLPKGISYLGYEQFSNAMANLQVGLAEHAVKGKCTNFSTDNKYLEMENGMKLCARYKSFDLVGEMLTFFTSRILGLDNVPPIKMVKYDRNSYLWGKVSNKFVSMPIQHCITMLNWHADKFVTLSLWIDDFGKIALPEIVLKCLKENSTVSHNSKQLYNMSVVELIDLMQWSDVFLFDFIVRNIDRAFHNHIHNCLANTPIKNLGLQQSSIGNKFWLIDNEYTFDVTRNKWSVAFNEEIMKTFCIFRKSTIENIKTAVKAGNQCEILTEYILQHDKAFWKYIQDMRKPTFYALYRNLMFRLNKVLLWVQECQSNNMTIKK